MPWLGLLLGMLIGAYADSFRGLVLGASAGLAIRLLWPPQRGGPSAPVATPAPDGERADAARIRALEQRVATLEIALARSGIALPAAPSAPAVSAAAVPAGAVQEAPREAPGLPEAMATPRYPVRKGGSGEAAGGGAGPVPAPVSPAAGA